MKLYVYKLVIDEDGNDFFSTEEKVSDTLEEIEGGWYDREEDFTYPSVAEVVFGAKQDIIIIASESPMPDAEEILGDVYDDCAPWGKPVGM